MTILVAFDGRDLAEVALERARSFADGAEEDLVAVSVVPDNADYARDRGWIGDEDSFGPERAIEHLQGRVAELAPEAQFRYELVDSYAPPGTIADRIRRVADHLDASVVFVGSEDAGGLVAPLSSVGGAVSASNDYDVYIARSLRSLPEVAREDRDSTMTEPDQQG